MNCVKFFCDRVDNFATSPKSQAIAREIPSRREPNNKPIIHQCLSVFIGVRLIHPLIMGDRS
ncbi:hypothetical protein [Fischerella thermalis]|uniref:hypothetical protein n=1 Tax=Fischerella thermalis TaxID=372787 RepID=UPI0011AFC482|nr:hypothetical protein [Fischerella thermalis]